MSSIPAGEPGRPLLLQVAKFPVTFLLELRLLPDGDDVNGGIRGHCLRHCRWPWVPGSLPSRRLGELHLGNWKELTYRRRRQDDFSGKVP